MKALFLMLSLFATFATYSSRSTTANKTSREEIIQLITRGVHHWSKQQYDSAAYYLHLSERKSLLVKDTQLLVACYNNQGLLSMAQGKYQKSLNLYQKSLNLYTDNIPNKSKLQALLNMGIAYKRMGNYNKSLEYLTKVTQYAKHFPQGKELASCYNEMGIIKKTQKLFQEALSYYLKSLDIRKKIDYKKGIAGSLNNIGIVYKELKQYDKALIYFNETLELKKQIGNKKSLASTYMNIGDLQLRLTDHINAEKNLLTSLKLKEEFEDRAGIISSSCLLGELYTKIKQYPKAESYLKRAQNLAEEIQALDLQKESYWQLKNLHVAKGDMNPAIAFYDLYLSARDSIFSRENVQNMQRLETQFKTREKEQEIKVLNLENENKDLQLTQSKQESIYLGASLLIILLALFPIAFLIKHRQKNKLLEERISGENKECNRISRELHDGVASSLSYLCKHMEQEDSQNTFIEKLRSISDEVRGISHQLNMNAIGSQSFRTALSDSLHLNHFPAEIELQIIMADDFEIGEYNTKINTIRIVQELVNNSLKHAQASTIVIKFNQDQKQVLVEYADDGIGINMEQLNKGNGLINIEERVAYLSGKMEIVTSPNNGFYIKLLI